MNISEVIRLGFVETDVVVKLIRILWKSVRVHQGHTPFSPISETSLHNIDHFDHETLEATCASRNMT